MSKYSLSCDMSDLLDELTNLISKAKNPLESPDYEEVDHLNAMLDKVEDLKTDIENWIEKF